VEAAVGKRLVFHLGGYDIMPPQAAHRRFLRELGRFQSTWTVAAQASEPVTSDGEARWTIRTAGLNWQVATDYRLVCWDDIIAEASRRSGAWRIPQAILAFVDFLFGGALWGYLRTNWRYAGFFLYPFLLLAGLFWIALFAGVALGTMTGTSLVGIGAGAALFLVLFRWSGEHLFLDHLFDDWIFARHYIRGEHPTLAARLDAAARILCQLELNHDLDEILITGHSLGAVLAIDLLDRALRLNPKLGQGRTRVALLSIGSSIPKIALHRGARRFRAAIARVANAPSIFWGEYQALTDLMNFYKVDPVAGMGVEGKSPVLRQVRIKAMLDPVAYRVIKRNFFRVPRVGVTIPHPVQGEAAAGVVLLRPAAAGTGVIAGGPVRAVLECAGIHDVLSKSLGSSNTINIVHATVAALKQLEEPRAVAARRGLEFDQVAPARLVRAEAEAAAAAKAGV